MVEDVTVPAPRTGLVSAPLTEMLAVEAVGGDVFTASGKAVIARPTLFGGVLLGQALLAAAQTVSPDYTPHHLHGEFLRAGRADEPLTFSVQRIKDGRTVSSRRVVGRQGERVIVSVGLAFQRAVAPGLDFQHPGATAFPEQAIAVGDLEIQATTLGVDVVDVTGHIDGPGDVPYQAWFRANHTLPNEAAWHASAMALTSDMGMPVVAVAAVGLRAGGPDSDLPGYAPTTSLNHTMWFHRPGRCDNWFLISARPLSTSHNRGLAIGVTYDLHGRQMATMVQEILIR